MKFSNNNSHIVDFLFVLGLFFTFTISAIFLVLIGSEVYKNTVTRMDQNYETRTAFAYITEKVRQGDIADSIDVVDFNGCQALILQQEYNDIAYATYLYAYNNNLMELFTSVGNDLPPESGQEIFKINDFNVEKLSASLYRITVTLVDNTEYQFLISSKSNHN